MGADEDIEDGPEAEELVIESLDGAADQNKVQPEKESFVENTEDAQIQQTESPNEEISKGEKPREIGALEVDSTEDVSRETIEPSAVETSAVESQATLDGSDSNSGEESLTEQSLSEDEVKEAAQSSDPIESIALKVAKKETPINAGGDAAKDFKSWLSNHSQDSYSLQLFSHSDLKAAKSFQESLDLADSYVYPADIEGKKRYRVLWGAFKTRAEAKQAIESLPPEILAQKPWIRQFSAISKEVSD
jgi:DamX protein